ncbi:MAG: hypothetical protein H6766_01970 [Candidatus Peribacteria bacterium]|nr:MAG: hypothetical protein H6766_01970 [Candidatus Peribacteria bacterium]
MYEQLNFLTTGEIVFVKVENSRFYMYAINLPRKEGSLERVSTFDITQQY